LDDRFQESSWVSCSSAMGTKNPEVSNALASTTDFGATPSRRSRGPNVAFLHWDNFGADADAASEANPPSVPNKGGENGHGSTKTVRAGWDAPQFVLGSASAALIVKF
jgi:hypothetical protein